MKKCSAFWGILGVAFLLAAGCAAESETGTSIEFKPVAGTSNDSTDGAATGADATDGGDTVDSVDGTDASSGTDSTAIEPECSETNAETVCNDKNSCTSDTCEKGLCVNTPNTEACDDNNACTSEDVCADGTCVGGAATECDDGSMCTKDECNSENGCVFLPLDGEPCDDGDACTLNDTCLVGECTTPGDILDCNDNNECTVDSCNPSSGCKNKLIVSQACRPNIVVDYPPRAASVVWDDLAQPTLTVKGKVTSGAGPITKLTLNGNEVTVSDDGTFSADITPVVGGNTIELDAEDSMGSLRKRVQSFHWSPEYLDPKNETITIPCEGTVSGNVCFQAVVPGEPGAKWGVGEQACQDWGGHLAAIHSETENAAVQEQIISVCGETAAWIGMNDNVLEGNYVWADGTEVDYENWNEGEPNDWEDDEDVIGMYANGKWNDFNGDGMLTCFVCARPTTKTQYAGHATPGMGIVISPALLDDGDHSLPPNDLATVFEMVFETFDLGKVIPNPAAENVGAAGAAYDVFINELTTAKPTVELSLIDGGWAIVANIKTVQAKITANKKSGSFLAPNKITGKMTIETITMLANVGFGVTDDFKLDASVEETKVTIDGVNVDIDGWLGGIIEGLIGGSIGTMMEDMEKQIADELGGVLAPMLVDALGTLAFGFDFELPSVDPSADAVQMYVATDFSSVDFKKDADVMALRSVAVPKTPVVTHESKGAPARSGCGQTAQTLAYMKEAPMEVLMNDDTVNLILYSAWRGGFLDFDLPPEMLGDFDLESLNIKNMVAKVSGLLPPSVSDCKDGVLMLHIGDIKLTATMDFAGKPLDIDAYASFDAEFEILVADSKISFGIKAIDNVRLELTALQDDQIPLEPVLVSLIQQNLVPSLMDSLTGGALGGLAIPDVELDAAGTMVSIGIDALWVKREGGTNIVGAKLKSE